jgi:hypothetical protein
MPGTGRRWVLTGRGSYDKLKLEEGVEKPKAGENEVLVDSERGADTRAWHR